MISHIKKLFPICRSITGSGTLKTIKYFKKINPSFKIISFKSGKKIYDWVVPLEWNIKSGYVKHIKTKKIFADFSKCNLHIVNFSCKINKFLNFSKLKKKIYYLPKQPDAIPYITSYYKKDWGFCMSYNQFKKMPKGNYKVVINSEHKKGKMYLSEAFLKGKHKKEIFFSSYICHPSMANNELSGPVLLNEIINYVKKIKSRYYSYRFVLLPETIGSIAYIYKNKKKLNNIFCGFNLSCVGDERSYSLIQNQNENCISSKAIKVALMNNKKLKIYSYLDRGSDERQYCNPNINLPLSGFCKSKYGTFPEYHTSLDNLNLVTQEGMDQSFMVFKNIINIFEKTTFPKNKIFCEPKLDKYNIYPKISFKNNNKKFAKNILNFLAYCDGKRNIFEILEIIKLPAKEGLEIISFCKKKKFI